jgi:hypothetical protein
VAIRRLDIAAAGKIQSAEPTFGKWEAHVPIYMVPR